MPEGSLYHRGWRQGSVVQGALPLHSVISGHDASPEVVVEDHELWVVATQDCDLDFATADSNEPVIELRPLFTENPPDNWGIRSQFLKVDGTRYLLGDRARCHVAPSVLMHLEAEREEPIAEIRTRALKTWLGLRYDRPAIPDSLLGLAQKIAEEMQRKRRRAIGERMRDVLMQFDENETPPHYSLYAVLEDEADQDGVRAWLADIALSVPAELGVGDQFEAGTADQISLTLIETSYPANVSQLTWGGSAPPNDG